MAYADLATIQATDPGDPLTAAWCDQVRDNDEFLIDPPAVSARATSIQAIASGSSTVLDADDENYDNDSMHSLVTNNSRLTFQTGGRYLVWACLEYQAFSGTNTRLLTDFLLDGAVVIDADMRPNVANASTANRLTCLRTFVVSAGDYVQVRANQNSGGSLNVALKEFGALYLTR